MVNSSRFRFILVTGFAMSLLLLTSSRATAGLFCPSRNVAQYQGTWSSNCNGHHGLLSAHVRPQSCNTYRVRFSGTFLGVVPFMYSVPMTATGNTADGGTALYGESKLPLFGDFKCYGNMNGNCFTARYISGRDQGQFVMQRR
ncbi:MAG: hypothetical protein R3C18_26860 [Planctomycetaceae bacterium]